MVTTTQSPRQSIYEAWKEGLTVAEIAKRLSLPRANVYYYLHQAGKRPHVQRLPEMTARQHRTALDLRRAGHTYSTIAKQLGVAYHQVRYACQKEGL